MEIEYCGDIVERDGRGWGYSFYIGGSSWSAPL